MLAKRKTILHRKAARIQEGKNVGRGSLKGRKLCLREKNILKIILREGVFEKKAIKEKIDKVFFSNKKGTRNDYFLKI